MTAITLTDTVPAAPVATFGWSRRVWNAVRVHGTNPWVTIYTPWLVVLTIFAATYSIWRIVLTAAGGLDNVDTDAFQYNGGVSWIVFFIMVLAIQAMSRTFRFALGFSITRRDYYVGTVVHFALLAVMFGAGLMVLAWLERITNGWGVRGGFFAPFSLHDAPLWEVGYVYVALSALMFGIGIAFGTAYVRWKSAGVLTLAAIALVALVASAWGITEAGAWASVGDFFTGQSLVAVVSWGFLPGAVSTVVGYFLMRRATL